MAIYTIVKERASSRPEPKASGTSDHAKAYMAGGHSIISVAGIKPMTVITDTSKGRESK